MDNWCIHRYGENNPLEIFDRTLQNAQGWKDLPYLQAMTEIKSALADSESDYVNEAYRMFLESLESLFCTYGRCILNPCRNRWIARTKVQEIEKPGWLCFDEKGNRIEVYKDIDSRPGSWQRETDLMLDKDWCWKLSADEAVMVTAEVIRARKNRGWDGLVERYDC